MTMSGSQAMFGFGIYMLETFTYNQCSQDAWEIQIIACARLQMDI